MRSLKAESRQLKEMLAELMMDNLLLIKSILGEALEQRRAKTANLKQAMKQELLTGRIRLV